MVSGLLLIGATPDAALMPGPALPVRASCAGPQIRVDGDFDQAGFAQCIVNGDGVTLTIQPESQPINPSPWYAVRLRHGTTRNAAAQPTAVTLVYEDARHRYAPWVSVDGGPWQRLVARDVGGDGRRVIVSIPPFSGTATLAAQPLVPLANIIGTWSARVGNGLVREEVSAASHDGRAVPVYRRGPADATTLHIFTARQHPPETTGAAAFDAFAAHLAGGASVALCPQSALIFAPVVNPDGLVRGHWRTNAAAIDLNRDWGAFTQPETAVVGRLMLDESRRATIATVLDFHSTRVGAVYVSASASARAAGFAEAVAAHTGLTVVPTRSRDGNTLKSWAEARLGSESFTIELPDSASPEQAAATGTAIAELFARHYLCSDAGEPS